MDALLKKYFWLVHLLVIGLCAGLAGRTAAQLIEQAWLHPVPSTTLSLRRFTPPAEQLHAKETGSIVRRNIFCSTCAPIAPASESVQATPSVVDNSPHKSDLQLELISTMVVPSDEDWSMAVIRDNSTKERDPALYRRGSPLPGGTARVLRIIERKVYLANNNRIEFLELEAAAAPNTPPGGPPVIAIATPPLPSGDPLENEINRGVRCSGSQCEIDRSLVEKVLSNTTMLATAARFVPSIKDGKPNGFKLYAIRPSSIFAKIGLQNGDTVKMINGMEMSSPDQALGVYTKVRSASHLTVAVDRRGETVNLDYTIR